MVPSRSAGAVCRSQFGFTAVETPPTTDHGLQRTSKPELQRLNDRLKRTGRNSSHDAPSRRLGEVAESSARVITSSRKTCIRRGRMKVNCLRAARRNEQRSGIHKDDSRDAMKTAACGRSDTITWPLPLLANAVKISSSAVRACAEACVRRKKRSSRATASTIPVTRLPQQRKVKFFSVLVSVWRPVRRSAAQTSYSACSGRPGERAGFSKST